MPPECPLQITMVFIPQISQFLHCRETVVFICALNNVCVVLVSLSAHLLKDSPRERCKRDNYPLTQVTGERLMTHDLNKVLFYNDCVGVLFYFDVTFQTTGSLQSQSHRKTIGLTNQEVFSLGIIK